MKSQNQHPDLDELRAFGLGRLDPDAMERVADHVSECDACCSRLNDLPDDTLLGRLRQADTPNPEGETLGGLSVRPVKRQRARVPEALREHPKYRILEHIGQGGMGDVFKAEHQVMGRIVALKVIRTELVKHERAVQRFHQEVRAAAGLDHRNIVTAHDAEQADGLHYLVMEYVEGRSLDKVVAAHGGLPVRHACHYARQVALGLAHAHERGMVHRDIKPQNLMLTPRGGVKILDFGLARLGPLAGGDRQDAGLTTAGTTLGTPDYVAPEQIRDSRSVDHRADLYGLGCTLFFLLAGQVPFRTDSYVSTLQAHLNREPLPLNQFRGDLPPALVELVRRLMSKRPQDRPTDAREVAELLAPFCRAGNGSTERVERVERAERAERAERSAASGTAPDQEDSETLVALQPVPSEPPSEVVQEEAEWQTEVKPWAREAVRSASGAGRGPSRRRWRAAVLPVCFVSAILGAAGLVWMFLPGFNWSNEPVPAPGPRTASTTTSPVADGTPILIVIPSQRVWYRDLRYFHAGLRDSQSGVEIACSTLTPVSSLDGETPGPNVQPDLLLDDVRAENYRAIVFVGYSVEEYLPGGAHGEAIGRILGDAARQPDCRVAGICAGNAVLALHGVLRGRRAAASPWAVELGARDDDAQWRPDPVVIDGPIMTAGNDQSAEQLARRIVAGWSDGP